MSSAFKKFKQLENQRDSPPPQKKITEERPSRKKLQTYNHIVTKFETLDGDERKKIVQERLKQRQLEKEAKLEEERKRKLEEEERIRRQQEEEERLRKEEEDRILREEEMRRAEEEEARRIEELRKKEESRFAGMKPAAMFERALEAKRSMQKSITGERIITLRKGTISEIRNKIFDSQPVEEPIVRKSKPVPKKIIVDQDKQTSNISNTESDCKVKDTKDEEKQNRTKKEDIDVKHFDNSKMQQQHKVTQAEPEIKKIEKEVEQKGSKRQSFISDFAALEKTYKILGMSGSKEQTETLDEEPKVVKKRHNSEGRVKNKDKAKRKSAVINNLETKVDEPVKKEPEPIILPDLLNKGKAANKKNFFQSLINEKKGLVKKEPELIGPQVRKRTSLTSFASNREEEDSKRKSMLRDEIRVDKKQFSSFLDKFESKDQRAEAKSKMIKITKQQKEFERKKQLLEEEQMRVEEEMRKEEERLRREHEEQEIIKAMEEEARQLQLQQEEEERLRLLEAEKLKEGNTMKRKVLKKKKKVKDDAEDDKEIPKLSLGVTNYGDVKKKFEKKKSAEEQPQELARNRSLKINKLNNPFLENTATEERTVKQEVKVNKLQKNAFMMELEKMGAAKEEVKPEPRLKKISSEAHIKFESKKDKNVVKEENKDQAQTEKKPQVHVSKSIEGHHPKKKNSRDNKTGSTISLQKIFIDGPKNFLRSSKEKLYKLSKENLYEIQKPVEKEPVEPKLSKSEMQNYLLSHVLFDGKEVNKKDKKEKPIKEEDEIDQYLDQEYKDKINKYCTLLEEEKQPKRKKKKKKKQEEKKVEEKAPTMKMVEIKSIQQQLFQQQNSVSEKTTRSEGKNVISGENKVNKFKEMFDNEPETVEVERRKPKENRKPRVKSDIFQKIQALEVAEKERLEREKANEERMKKLLEQEMERQKLREEESPGGDLTENVAEENFKNDIMKCLEDEVLNLEQEMLALETEEMLILEEENEEEDSKIENSEIDSHINQLHEIQHEIEERKKTAASKKKVLERFQHVLDADKEEQNNKGRNIGSIKDKLTNFLENGERKDVKSFDDSVFVGVSDVMSKFKSKIESKQEEQPSLFSKDEIKRKPNAIALQFEQLKPEDEEMLMSPKLQQSQKDWNWKKKTAQELHDEVEGPKEKAPVETKKKNSYQDAKFNELLSDINAVKKRLNERDAARQEKENERKLREMEEAIKEVQEALARDESDDELPQENENKNVKTRVQRRKEITKPARVQEPSNQKIGELKSQLLSMINDDNQEKPVRRDSIDVNISLLRDKLTSTEEKVQNVPLQPSKSKSSSTLVSKIAKNLTKADENDYEDTPLNKAPKRIQLVDNIFDMEETPSMTLEQLKEANQSKVWAWKEKDMTDIQNYITAYDDVAPNTLIAQQQKLKDLDDEERVLESLTKDKNTDILVQIREEKEQEFEKFMSEIHSYLAEGPQNVEEIEFKKGIKDYVDLIQDRDERSASKVTLPKVQLNTVCKMKSSLFDETEDIAPKKASPKVQKLDKSKLEREFTDTNASKVKKNDLVIPKQNISSVKQAFENERKKQEQQAPEIKKDPSKSLSIVEKFKKRALEEKQRKLEHQLKHKLKTITELQDYILVHESLGTEKVMLAVRKFQISKESEKLKFHSEFMEDLTEFLNQTSKSEEEKIFRSNIQSYLTIVNNTESIYNATPKLKKHNGTGGMSQSNIRKATLEKSCERKASTEIKPLDKEPIENATEISKSRILSPEEKKKEILAKYGFKDRSNLVIQQISDDSDSSDSDEEVDIKQMTDKQLAEKYGLPYVEIEEEQSIKKSDSVAGYTSLLSKIRTLGQEKTQSPIQNRKVFERRNSIKESGIERSDSMARIRKTFESESPVSEDKESPVPMSNHVTMRIKNKLTEKQPERKSWAFENEELLKYGSTTKMKQRFENDSPDSSRCSSPAKHEPGTIMTNRMKKLFEDNKPEPEPLTPAMRNRGLLKSSTISNVGAMFKEGQSPITARHVEMLQSPAVRRRIVDKYIEQEKNKEMGAPTPGVGRPGSLEKSKSLSKIKNAFEFGKGLNDEMEDVDDLQSRKSIHAELELLRSPSSKDISSPLTPQTQRRETQPKDEKSSLVAAFFSGQNRGRSGSVSMESKKPLPQKIESPKLMGGLQKSSTASDISAYLKHKFEENPSPSPQQSPKKIMPEVNSPQVQRSQSLARSSSFSKFKDSFEDGVGLMDAETVETDKVRVNAELNALKSSTKIQSMFRINKSSRTTEEQKAKDEATAPKISVDPPSTNYSDRTERKSNRNAPRKEEELQDRKWVFDTIQRYYDVIVEEEEDDEEEEEEEEDAQAGEESESDYDSAEDEIPEISLPPINKTLPTRQFPSTTHRASPTLSLPMQRARASTGRRNILNKPNSMSYSYLTSIL